MSAGKAPAKAPVRASRARRRVSFVTPQLMPHEASFLSAFLADAVRTNDGSTLTPGDVALLVQIGEELTRASH